MYIAKLKKQSGKEKTHQKSEEIAAEVILTYGHLRSSFDGICINSQKLG